MPTLFTNLIDNDLAHFVYSDEECVAFLDIRPAAPGHCLIVPRVEVDEWTDLEPELAKHLMAVAQTIAKAQKQVFSPDRVGLLIAGFEVAHTHLHSIPIDSMSDFELGKKEASSEVLAKNAKDLISALASK